MPEIIIKNAWRCRKFGLGISTTPSGHGTEILPPTGPDYTGTIKQIYKQMADYQRYLRSIQSAYKRYGFFYDGKVITSVLRYGSLRLRDGLTGEHDEYSTAFFKIRSLEDLEDGIGKDGSLKIMIQE